MENNIVHIGNADVLYKEYKGQRVVTLKDIDMVHGRPDGTARRNFNANKKHLVEGEDYFVRNSSEAKAEFNIIAPNGLALMTKQGYLMLAKSLTDDLAWDVQRQLVNKYFRTEGRIDKSQLSPQMQLMNMLVENMSKQELEQKRQAEEIAQVKQTVSNIKKELTEPIADWKLEINLKVRQISVKSSIEYSALYNKMYGELENTAHCSLKRLQENKIARMEKAGNTKMAIKEATTKIAIIEDNPRLKAIFENIVRRYAMSYCV